MPVKKNKNNIKWSKVAIVGIESAIVLIAFVIVAAALAFVVLNMGFFTTQKSKETIGSGLGEASTALEIDGSVVAHVSKTGQNITYIDVPLKLSAGKSPVDLTPGKSTVAYWSPNRGVSYVNIYVGALSSATYNTVESVIKTFNDTSYPNLTYKIGNTNYTYHIDGYGYAYIAVNETSTHSSSGRIDNVSIAVIAWVTNINNDKVLDPGEKVILVIFFGKKVAPQSYDIIKAEIKVPIGAALTIDRSIPPSLTQEIVDLG
jgi:flagellin FlaB